MHRPSFTPGLFLVCIAAFAAMAAGMTLWASYNAPWLGVTLVPSGEYATIERAAFGMPAGARLETLGIAGQQPMDLLAGDLLAEPDGLARFADLDSFLVRQDRLSDLLDAPELELHFRTAGGDSATAIAVPQPRSLLTLPASFWVQLITGIASFLISGWVWALRPRQLGPMLFAISGLGVLMTTLTSAFYAHRGLALPTDAYAFAMPINHAGALMFGGGLVGLFLIYPRPLARTGWLWLIPALLAPYFLSETFRIGVEADLYYNVALALVIAMLALICVQWWATRSLPADRAALGWLGLSVALGVGIFSFLAIAPQLLGFDSALSQHYAAGALILIYAGLALGLRSYRLFELGDWAYRVLFYTVGAFLLLGLDAALIALLNFELAPALGVSLLLVAALYIPFRDWLWQTIFARSRLAQHELFSAAMEVAFAPSRADSRSRWLTLLRRLFDPLETTELADRPDRPTITEDGLTLDMPPVAGAAPLRLSYPFGGNGLFKPSDLSLANQFVTLIARAEEGREAYMRGVGEERRRMARDLHDDVGARLLTGLHTADETTRPTLQAALSDIRAIVSGLSGEEASLDRVLAETRHEAARRLEAAEITLDWPLPEAEVDAVHLDYRLHKALTSAVREIVSNVIRHSGATTFKVVPTLSTTNLALHFTDNGRGIPPEALAGETPGFGLRNLRHRIEDIGGHLRLDGSASGTTIMLDIPLALVPHTPEPGVPASMVPLNSQT